MDPTTALVGVIVAGASAAAKDVAGTAVKDLYTGLKSALSKFLTRPETVDAVEADPDSDAAKSELENAIKSSAATTDKDIGALAAKLAEAITALDEASLAKASIEIGAVKAAQNAILRDFQAEGGIKIDSVTAEGGDAVITGMTAGNTAPKK